MANFKIKSSYEELDRKFNSAKNIVFRLELLQDYDVEGEDEDFKNFLSGEPPNPEGMKDWTDLVKDKTGSGIVWERVRFAKKPYSEYLKYEVSWGYRYSILNGERVKIIESTREPAFIVETPELCDFWVVDSEVFIMEYDLNNRFVGVSKVRNEFSYSYIELMHELILKSCDIENTDLSKYIT